MKFSIVTVCFNAENTVGEACISVAAQGGCEVEHVLVDGGSTDRTLDEIAKHAIGNAKVISEPDEGIFDAMNKGWRLADGDIVGFLNADDYYAYPSALRDILKAFKASNADIVYGDVDMVRDGRVKRKWRPGPYKQGQEQYGWHPAHQAFFVKRNLFERLGGFKKEFKLAGDYELMLRFLRASNIKLVYVPVVVAKMRAGGASNASFRAHWRGYQESIRVWTDNRWAGGRIAAILKPLQKLRFIRF